MDYMKRSHVQYEGPPLKVNWDECRPKPRLPWHGYTGARGYFPEPPLPSFQSYVAHNSCKPLKAGVKHYEIRYQTRGSTPPPGIPFHQGQLAALHGPELMTKRSFKDLHPREIAMANPKLWRYDGRNYHFAR